MAYSNFPNLYPVDLSEDEVGLLLRLQKNAQAIAPQLGEAIYNRWLLAANHRITKKNDNDHIQKISQAWFIHLFQDAKNAAPATSRELPINLLLYTMDLILQYGHQVTQSSNWPNQAMVAFHRSLTRYIAIQQSQNEQHFHQLYEMLLWD
jgi:hypothetical protein